VSKRHIKKGLELNKDYRGVNKEVWVLLNQIYGGGPVIAREELDIYSKDVTDQYLQSVSKEVKLNPPKSPIDQDKNNNN